MAEGVLKHLVSQRSDAELWNLDSCGTAGYHVGGSPDRRTMRTLKEHGVTDYQHKARTLRHSDFTDFKWIFVFDGKQ